MLPFDLRCLNDIAFVVDMPLIPVSKLGIGSGMLIPDYGFGTNLAKSCWLIDNYMIQFSSYDQNMYIYDMVTREISSHALSTLTSQEIQWMSRCCLTSNDLLLKIRKFRYEPQNIRQEALGYLHAAYFNILFCNVSSYIPKDRMDTLDEHIAFINHNWDTEYRNGSFYKDGKKLSYGEMSRGLANLIRNE